MECKVFRKRLTDLIEDNISYDLKEAMLDHIAECEACRALYEEELSIDETIEKGLSIDAGSFRSLRGDIMKSIDKDRYGKSPFKKFLYHMKKYRGTYTSVAAVITAAIFITPYISKNGIGFGAKKTEMMDQANAASQKAIKPASEPRAKGMAPEVLDKQQTFIAPENNALAIRRTDVYIPIIKKFDLDKTYKATFNTPWKTSDSKRYSATIEGKGEAASEEGIGRIIIKDSQTGQQWSFEMVENEKQFTPKSVTWIDEETLLIIVGLAHGTVSHGGQIYFLNINTSDVTLADPENKAKKDEKSEITKVLSVKKLPTNELELNLEMLVYEDDILNKNHTENRPIVIQFK
jgi:hypothetical protein